MDETAVRTQVEAWLMGAVIGLNLCPFAAPFVRQKLVRIVVSDAKASNDVLGVMIDEILALTAEDAAFRTTLVVTPQALQDFGDFIDLVGQTDHIIDETKLRGRVQLAHFHPEYLFDGAPPEDHGHWTNRAPFPILHLLREDDVEDAVARYDDAEGIPGRNIARLRGMSLAELRKTMLGKS